MLCVVCCVLCVVCCVNLQGSSHLEESTLNGINEKATNSYSVAC